MSQPAQTIPRHDAPRGRRLTGVLLGVLPNLLPCQRENPDIVSCELYAHFLPDRLLSTTARLRNGTRRDISCPHPACLTWAEEHANQLCPLKRLPAIFYDYVADQGEREYQMYLAGAVCLEEDLEIQPLWKSTWPTNDAMPIPWERIAGILAMLGGDVAPGIAARETAHGN